MKDYYNEYDKKTAAWLRELIKQGHLPDGDVDERSIEDVVPRDLIGYRRHHFFAGIGGWAYALELAGWPDDQPVWTGSCPCQPFSSAGKGAAFADDRHLWPAWQRLIATCKPTIIVGEQVASFEVMGGSDKSMYSMYGGQTPDSVQAIYRARKIWASSAVQGMSASLREIVAIELAGATENSAEETREGGGSVRAGISGQEQGSLFGWRVQKKGGKKRGPVRSSGSSAGDSKAHEQRVLRGYRNTLESRPNFEDGVRQSVDRPNRPSDRVHLPEHSDRLFCSECDDGIMGREIGLPDSEELGHERGELDDERRTSGTPDFGVDEKSSRAWIDLVFDDLEGADYACAAVAFPAAGGGAPHIRDRNYWVAYANSSRLKGCWGPGEKPLSEGRDGANRYFGADRMGGRITDRQGNVRPIEPGLVPLAHGLPARVVRLRGYGNAIVPQQAAEFLISMMQVIDDEVR